MTIGIPVPPLTLRLDDVGGGVIYIGEAAVGTGESDAEWRIKRLTEVGADMDIKWADGTHGFSKAWSSRLGYAYS
jgi:hypothetical protein